MSYNLCNITEDKIPSEINQSIINNTLLYPIAKSFLESHNSYDDIINSYDHAMADINEIIEKEKIIEKLIRVDNKTIVSVKLNFANTRIYPTDSIESKQYSTQGFNPTPNIALAKRGTYSATVLSDCHYSISQYTYSDSDIEFNKKDSQELASGIIPDAYNFNFPIPIYSKYCALRHYDQPTLIRTGEEISALYGFFIIEGFVRYIINVDRKPFNHEIVQRNLFDEQLSRTEVLYTKIFEYEDSYYVVASMLQEKQAHVGRSGAIMSPPDFVFSLQLNDPTMNTEGSFNGKRSKKLINAVPIRLLFYAFGCTSDLELLKYVDPQLNNFGLMHTVRNACILGFKHREIMETANINYNVESNWILFNEPLDQELALYMIGTIILNKETKDKLLEKFKTTEQYRLNVAELTNSILQQRFMPGIGLMTSIDRNRAICVEIGQIVRDLYMVGYNLSPSQDKASLLNKRVRSGSQIEREFKSFHGVRLREIFDEIQKHITNPSNLKNIRQTIQDKIKNASMNAGKAMTASLINSFKGTCKEQSKLRTNLITMKNILFVRGSLREIVKTPSTQQKGSDVTWEHRAVHQSELFFIDPIMTPESGSQTGRFKMPTIYTMLTLSHDGHKEVEFVKSWKNYIEDIYGPDGSIIVDASKLYNIKINGSIIGYIEQYANVDELYNSLLKARRTKTILRDSSVILNHNTGNLSIWTDTGRLTSPFVIINNCFEIDRTKLNSKVKIQPQPEFIKWLSSCSTDINCFEKGLDLGYIELLDAEMAITNMVIAPCIREFYENPGIYTHIALPQHTYGIVTSMVPAINMNKGVREALITNHVKQAIAAILRYPQLKYIVEQHILIAPQIPISRTCVYDFSHIGETPYGQNVIVAFMYYKYNQEDSIILNQASVESGLLEIDTFLTKISEITRDEEFKIPENVTLHGNPDSYQKLDVKTCLPKRIGDQFFQYDALIGKINKTPQGITDISLLNSLPDGKYPPSVNSRALRSVVKSRIHEEDSAVKMAVFGQFQTAIVGDKFNSECAQKGTVGKVVSVQDMPYTSSGVKPDIIFNPPSIFKRVTYAQVYTAYIQKIACLLGCTIDCTPAHTARTTEDLIDLMHKIGMHESGEEIMYDPDTGRQYRSKIFCGVHYWERQPHIVEKKLNIRNGGPKTIDTHMPVKGRKKGGGQSIDRMAMDCFFSAGINLLNRDEHLERCSKMLIGVCNICHGLRTYFHQQRRCWICSQCGEHSDFTIKVMPPAANLVSHIFNALHVSIDYMNEGNLNDTFGKTLKNK